MLEKLECLHASREIKIDLIYTHQALIYITITLLSKEIELQGNFNEILILLVCNLCSSDLKVVFRPNG